MIVKKLRTLAALVLIKKCDFGWFFYDLDMGYEVEAEITRNLRMDECYLLCGKVVSTIVSEEESRDEDEWVGYTEGLQAVIQVKNHVQLNVKCCIEYAKLGNYRTGIMPCKYIQYYLEQELDFNTWFLPLLVSKIPYKKHSDSYTTVWIPDLEIRMPI